MPWTYALLSAFVVSNEREQMPNAASSVSQLPCQWISGRPVQDPSADIYEQSHRGMFGLRLLAFIVTDLMTYCSCACAPIVTVGCSTTRHQFRWYVLRSLDVPLLAVAGGAEHYAVLCDRLATLAPWRLIIGLHALDLEVLTAAGAHTLLLLAKI
nr:hypothetical protein [Paenarthrobacter sp. Z7-10]